MFRKIYHFNTYGNPGEVLKLLNLQSEHHLEQGSTTTNNPDSKVHWANFGPIWAMSAPDEPNVGPMNLAIREGKDNQFQSLEQLCRLSQMHYFGTDSFIPLMIWNKQYQWFQFLGISLVISSDGIWSTEIIRNCWWLGKRKNMCLAWYSVMTSFGFRMQ